LSTFLEKIKKKFSFKYSAIAAVFMGALIFSTQYYAVHNMELAVIAGMKQAVYSFMASAVLIAIAESVVTTYRSHKYCAFYGFMAAWLTTSIFVTIVHNMKGTPDPIDAIILNILSAPPGLIFISIRKKRMLRKEAQLITPEV
jgi:hypothetical protein